MRQVLVKAVNDDLSPDLGFVGMSDFIGLGK